MSSKNQVRLAGVALLAVLGAMFAFTGALYTRAFADPAEITLRTQRSGLVMDPGNKVKMRGVEIGRVGSVEDSDDGARLVLELDRDELERIPANVGAVIKATTVFGAKYVELVAPAEPASARLASGDVIDVRSVTTEVNTVFDGLDKLLSGIDVTDLSTTLTVLARGLEGRGGSIAALAAQADAYLTRLEPLLPQLREDMVLVARFARLGNQVSPALLSILENAAVTADTVATEQQALHRLLVDLSVLGATGTRFVGVNDDQLRAVLKSLRPTSALLEAYSSELPCFLKGLDRTQQIMTDTFGGVDAGLRARLTIRSELPPYTAGRDFPDLPLGTGPGCHGLPSLTTSDVPFPERGAPQ